MRLGNDSPSFTPVHSQIRAIGPRDLHLAKGHGLDLALFRKPKLGRHNVVTRKKTGDLNGGNTGNQLERIANSSQEGKERPRRRLFGEIRNTENKTNGITKAIIP